MTSRVGSWFWKRLGGEFGDDGLLKPDGQDPVVIFSGSPEDARPVKEQLEAAGLTVVAHARVADPRGLAVDLGVSPSPSPVQLEIRSADVERAVELLELDTPLP